MLFTGSGNANKISGIPVQAGTPANGNTLQYDAATARWVFAAGGGGGGGSNPGGTGTEIQYRGGPTTFSPLTNSSVPNLGEVLLSTVPTPGATRSVFTLGSAIVGGNAAANGGTYYGLNAPSGFVGDFIRFELNGAAAFSVNRLGTVTVGTANTFGSSGVSVSNVGVLAYTNASSGASAATRVTGSAGTGSGNYLALRPTSASSGPDVLRVNADQRAVMIGQTVNTTSLSNMSLYISDRTATTGNTREAVEAGQGQSTDLLAFYAYNATPLAGTKYLWVDSDGFLGTVFSTPASSSEVSAQGRLKFDANYIYVCTATNTWKRVALATF